MLKSFLNSLLTTATAMTPFLLSACGDDSTNSPQKFEIVAIPLLFFTVSLAHSWLKSRQPSAQQAF
jgi:hypothetical protein